MKSHKIWDAIYWYPYLSDNEDHPRITSQNHVLFSVISCCGIDRIKNSFHLVACSSFHKLLLLKYISLVQIQFQIHTHIKVLFSSFGHPWIPEVSINSYRYYLTVNDLIHFLHNEHKMVDTNPETKNKIQCKCIKINVPSYTVMIYIYFNIIWDSLMAVTPGITRENHWNKLSHAKICPEWVLDQDGERQSDLLAGALDFPAIIYIAISHYWQFNNHAIPSWHGGLALKFC